MAAHPGLSRAQDAQGDAQTQPKAEEPKSKTHTVASADLTLSFDRDGRIDSVERVKVRLLPEAFGGAFEVVEVVKEAGRVKKDDLLIRFDSEAMDKALDEARVAVDHAKRRLAIAHAEQKIMQEDNVTRVEQVQKAREKAQKELEIWDKYDGPDMLRQAELGLQQREFGLADQKQELSQLEEMYSGTHLAQETKDIVLDRARRGVMMSEEYLKLSKNDDVISRQYRHPMQDMAVRDGVKWSMEGEAHAKVSVVTSEDRKSMEVEGAERAVRDAEEKLKKLEGDVALLEVKAPADGVMTRIELEPKDTVNARQTICEILDPANLVVKFSAQPEDLRMLAPVDGEGVKQVTLRLPDFSEVKLTGTITEMAEMISSGGGGGGGEANTIPVTVKIEGANPLVRLGLKCKVHAERTLDNVLAIPKEAVKWEGADAKVKVMAGGADDQPQDRTIIVGPANEKMIMVVEGLKAGDEVVIDDKK